MRKFLRWIVMPEGEWNWQIGQARELAFKYAKKACDDLETEKERLKREVSALQKDLGLTVKKVVELKEESERYKEEAMRQIEEKKALYERVRKADF